MTPKKPALLNIVSVRTRAESERQNPPEGAYLGSWTSRIMGRRNDYFTVPIDLAGTCDWLDSNNLVESYECMVGNVAPDELSDCDRVNAEIEFHLDSLPIERDGRDRWLWLAQDEATEI